ncbi:MAG TPA: AMP-binding protein, partial [Petrotogaceae bacterium]|nr:AMP-binding protein [Petrotogaceae bacterium]
STKDLDGLKMSIEKVFNIKAGTNYLCTADFGWVTGFYYGIFMPIISDLNFFIVKNMNGFRLMKALSKFREWDIQVIYTSPSFLNIAYRFFKKYETNIKEVYTVGEKLAVQTKKKYLELGYEITDTWWQTELGCISVSGRVKAQTSFPLGTMIVQDYIGKPLDFVDIALLNDDNIVPVKSILRIPNAELTGELLVNRRTHPSIMKEYYKADENARKKFIGDYYKTGDLVRIIPEAKDSQEYNIQYVSRADDVIVIAGELISPDEIESLVMKKFGSINECCAVSADKKIVLFISSDEKSLSDGSCASESLEAQIKKVVAENLMPSMIPYKVVKIEVLPKTESGKIKRNELRRIAHGLIQE